MPIAYDYEGKPFPAVDADGKRYVLTLLCRRRQAKDGTTRESGLGNDCVGFRTDVGQDAIADGPGRYLVLGTDPSVVLTSDHPDAV